METDVFIAGAGLAGSIAALSYSKAGRNVIIADPFVYNDNAQDLFTIIMLFCL